MKEILIPESEMEVMKVLWARSPQSLPEIVENVRRTMPWEAVTVKTLLGRLVKKELPLRTADRPRRRVEIRDEAFSGKDVRRHSRRDAFVLPAQRRPVEG